jgi:hypothetical protein
MNIFISWSGTRSKAAATALKEWIPDILQSTTAWMSEHDIDAGTRWSHRLTEVLEDSRLGIICLTPENQGSPWILFEAGALSKSLQGSKLVPLLIGMTPSDVRPPLSQFQAVQGDAEGVFKLLESVNSICSEQLTTERMRRLFDKFWPDLEAKISAAIALGEERSGPVRSERDMLGEVLELVRSLAKPSDRRELLAPLGEFRVIDIDTHSLLGASGGVFKLKFNLDEAVSEVLDRVFYMLAKQANIKAYTYGEVWLLKNPRNEKVYDDIGIEYCRSRGRVIDETPMRRLGIEENDRLLVIRGWGRSPDRGRKQ